MTFTWLTRRREARARELADFEWFWQQLGEEARAERGAHRGGTCPRCMGRVRLTGHNRVAVHSGCDYSDRAPMSRLKHTRAKATAV